MEKTRTRIIYDYKFNGSADLKKAILSLNAAFLQKYEKINDVKYYSEETHAAGDVSINGNNYAINIDVLGGIVSIEYTQGQNPEQIRQELSELEKIISEKLEDQKD